MKKKFVSLVATAAIITSAATTVQAEEVTVQKGDTLWGFSQDYGVSVESIKKWNNLSSDLIYPEDILTVSPYITVKVKKGDTLWDIAQANKVAVDDLMDWNNLSSDIIHPGLNVKVYTDKDTATVTKGQTKRTKVKATVNNKGQAIQNTKTESAPPAPTPSKEAEGSQAVSVKKEAKTVEVAKQPAQASKAPEVKEEAGKVITVEATAYTASCKGCSGITSTGINLKENPDAKVISVDPSVIPLGSKVHVEGYGIATAADTGGAIKGNKIDVFIPDYDDAVKYGRKQVKVEIID